MHLLSQRVRLLSVVLERRPLAGQLALGLLPPLLQVFDQVFRLARLAGEPGRPEYTTQDKWGEKQHDVMSLYIRDAGLPQFLPFYPRQIALARATESGISTWSDFKITFCRAIVNGMCPACGHLGQGGLLSYTATPPVRIAQVTIPSTTHENYSG